MKTIKKMEKKYGSVLVFSLIVLFIGVVAALGIASTTIISQKMSGTTGKSMSSFQIADSGAEIVLQKIYKRTTENIISDLFGNKCNGGIVSDSINSSLGKNYSVTFFDNISPEPNQLSCDDDISKIAKIHSVGTYASTSRAVEVAVAGSRKCDWNISDSDSIELTNLISRGVTGSCYKCNDLDSDPEGLGSLKYESGEFSCSDSTGSASNICYFACE